MIHYDYVVGSPTRGHLWREHPNSNEQSHKRTHDIFPSLRPSATTYSTVSISVQY